jgi:hypothetical protein
MDPNFEFLKSTSPNPNLSSKNRKVHVSFRYGVLKRKEEPDGFTIP